MAVCHPGSRAITSHFEKFVLDHEAVLSGLIESKGRQATNTTPLIPRISFTLRSKLCALQSSTQSSSLSLESV